MVKQLPTMFSTLGSNPSTTIKKKKKKTVSEIIALKACGLMDCYMSPFSETILTTLVHGKCWYYVFSCPIYYCRHSYVLKLGSDSALWEHGIGHQKDLSPGTRGWCAYEDSDSGTVLLEAIYVTFSVFSPSGLEYQ